MLHRMTMEIALNSPIMKILYTMILINSRSHGEELIHILILKKIQIGDI